MWILGEDHEVRQFARRNTAFDVLFEGSESPIHRADAYRLIQGDALIGAPDAASEVFARDHTLQCHQGFEGTWCIVGCRCNWNVIIQKRLVGKHPAHFFFTILYPFIPVVMHIGIKGGRYHA